MNEENYFKAPQNAQTDTDKFPVIEIFGPTIQGEGMMIGEKTMFIRFGGCDYRCKQCDSMHAVMPEAVKKNATWMTTGEIVDKINTLVGEKECDWITISGGNPAMWDLREVVEELHSHGYRVCVETQGSIWRDWLGEVDTLTVCPKGPGMGEKFRQDQFVAFLERIENHYNRMSGRLAVCIKSVVFDQKDFEFAVGLDEVLATRDSQFWPKHDRYLSLGNPFPPQLQSDMNLADPDKLFVEADLKDQSRDSFLREQLLQRYETLLEDYLNDPRLVHWKLLPQLHVLVWANKAGV